jgi:hypothetical protein
VHLAAAAAAVQDLAQLVVDGGHLRVERGARELARSLFSLSRGPASCPGARTASKTFSIVLSNSETADGFPSQARPVGGPGMLLLAS